MEASEVNHPDGRESARSDAAYNLSLVLGRPYDDEETIPGFKPAWTHRFGLVSHHNSVCRSAHHDVV